MKPLHRLYAFFFPSTKSVAVTQSNISRTYNDQITVKNVIKKSCIVVKKIYVDSCKAWRREKYTRNMINLFCIHHFAVVVRIVE